MLLGSMASDSARFLKRMVNQIERDWLTRALMPGRLSRQIVFRCLGNDTRRLSAAKTQRSPASIRGLIMTRASRITFSRDGRNRLALRLRRGGICRGRAMRSMGKRRLQNFSCELDVEHAAHGAHAAHGSPAPSRYLRTNILARDFVFEAFPDAAARPRCVTVSARGVAYECDE